VCFSPSVRHSKDIMTWQLSPEFFLFNRTLTEDYILLRWIRPVWIKNCEAGNKASGNGAGFRGQHTILFSRYSGVEPLAWSLGWL
jgi:hypothetical protein